MDPIDREVLALRHFEQLTNAEAARVLGHQGEGRRQCATSGPWSGSRRSSTACPAAWRSSDHERRSTSGPDPFDRLADEFAERYRQRRAARR